MEVHDDDSAFSHLAAGQGALSSRATMLSSRAANVSTAVAHLSTNVARSAPPILVLGGGIAGLSCAYYLSKLPNSLLQGRKVLVIESQSTPGGWLQSENFSDGVVHELGPRSIRTAGLVGLNTLNLVC